MSRQCTVCAHRQHEKIDALLIAGTSYRDVSNRFSLSRTAVWRHRNDHIPQVLAKVGEFKEIQHGIRLHDQITGLIKKSLAILAKAERLGDLKIALAAIRETRNNLELLGKASGELNSPQDQRPIGPMFIFPPGSQPSFNITPPDAVDEQSSESEPIDVEPINVSEDEDAR